MAEKIVKDSQGLVNDLVNDTISRKAAIVAVCKFECEKGFCGVPCAEVDALKALPSAQPEWKKGKWVYAEDEYGIDGYHCNQCGFFVPWDYIHKFINYIEDYNFCPNCGADMRGEQDEAN